MNKYQQQANNYLRSYIKFGNFVWLKYPLAVTKYLNGYTTERFYGRQFPSPFKRVHTVRLRRIFRKLHRVEFLSGSVIGSFLKQKICKFQMRLDAFFKKRSDVLSTGYFYCEEPESIQRMFKEINSQINFLPFRFVVFQELKFIKIIIVLWPKSK